MTIGTGVFFPQAKFWFPRSYVSGIYFATYAGNSVTFNGSFFVVHAPFPDPTTATMIPRANFWAWSSNKRSLDFVVDEWYFQTVPFGLKQPLDYTLSYINDPPHHATALKFEWTGLPPTFQYFAMPPQPADYWRPKPLP